MEQNHDGKCPETVWSRGDKIVLRSGGIVEILGVSILEAPDKDGITRYTREYMVRRPSSEAPTYEVRTWEIDEGRTRRLMRLPSEGDRADGKIFLNGSWRKPFWVENWPNGNFGEPEVVGYVVVGGKEIEI